MKINWRILVAITVIIGIVLWAVSSVLPRSFSGTHLTIGVGSGTVMVNNLSDVPVPVQLIGNGSRTFAVSSRIEGLSGSSTRQGSGNSTTQLFEYMSPPGVSEFTVARGNNVNFVSNTDSRLEVIAQPLTESEARTTIIVAAIVVLGSLFYVSRYTGHGWIRAIRRREVPVLVAAPVVETPVGDPNRGRDGRMYSSYGNKD